MATRPEPAAPGCQRTHRSLLSCDHKLRAAVARPSRVIVSRLYRAILAIADRRDARTGNAQMNQFLTGSLRAAFAQRSIVLRGATFVGVTFDDESLAVALQSAGDRFE